MKHIFKIFNVSRETMQKAEKTDLVRSAFSAVDVGVKEKDMVNKDYAEVFLARI